MIDGDAAPDLCLYVWREGVSRKRHICNRLDYPNHHHSCCCGKLLTAALASSLNAAARKRVEGEQE